MRLQVQGGGDVPATVSCAAASVTLLPGQALEPGTTYTVTVSGTVTDTAGNPLGSDASWAFTTALRSRRDTTVANFGAGTSSGTYVSQVADGEVILSPSLGEEFNGTSAPAGWTVAGYGGTPAVSAGGGQITLDSAAVGTPTAYDAGVSAEFVATFSATNPYQSAIFHSDPSFNTPPYAGFYLALSGTQLWASDGLSDTSRNETLLASVALGVPHLFRIVWGPSSVTYFVDGAQLAQHSIAIGVPMRFYLADYGGGPGAPLTADWVHLSPYAASGTFTSRVFDSGGTATWQDMTWTADIPTGTALDLSVRSGDTAAPDATWSAFAPVAASGSVLGLQARYLQYRAALSTSDPLLTPVLRDVSIAYSGGAPGAQDQTITFAPLADRGPRHPALRGECHGQFRSRGQLLDHDDRGVHALRRHGDARRGGHLHDLGVAGWRRGLQPGTDVAAASASNPLHRSSVWRRRRRRHGHGRIRPEPQFGLFPHRLRRQPRRRGRLRRERSRDVRSPDGTGGRIVPGDLVAAGDGKSAVFTAHAAVRPRFTPSAAYSTPTPARSPSPPPPVRRLRSPRRSASAGRAHGWTPLRLPPAPRSTSWSTITNSGDAPLSALGASDPRLSAASCSWPASLAPGADASCVVGPVNSRASSARSRTPRWPTAPRMGRSSIPHRRLPRLPSSRAPIPSGRTWRPWTAGAWSPLTRLVAYGPRRADTYTTITGDDCSPGTTYAKSTIEMSSDYVKGVFEAMGYTVSSRRCPAATGRTWLRRSWDRGTRTISSTSPVIWTLNRTRRARMTMEPVHLPPSNWPAF